MFEVLILPLNFSKITELSAINFVFSKKILRREENCSGGLIALSGGSLTFSLSPCHDVTSNRMPLRTFHLLRLSVRIR